MDNSELLHRPALEMLLTLATSDVRWRSRAQLASDCGITPSTFSNALNPKTERGLSEAAIEALCREVPGCTRDALVLPVRARRGDLETARLLAEIKRKREADARWGDEILRALRERNGG